MGPEFLGVKESQTELEESGTTGDYGQRSKNDGQSSKNHGQKKMTDRGRKITDRGQKFTDRGQRTERARKFLFLSSEFVLPRASPVPEVIPLLINYDVL